VPNRDLILLETVKTHRARLASAFVFGELTERRVANDNVRRLIGGIIAAAVLCVGCVGFSFVSGLLGQQAAARQAQAGAGPATGAAFVADTFDRTVRVGWGTAELGGPWTVQGPPTAYAVSAGAATAVLSKNQVRGGYLGRQLQDRSDVTVTVQRTMGSRNGTVAVAVVGRRVSSTQDYRANVILGEDGSVALNLSRRSEPTRPGEPAEASLSDTVILLGPGSEPDADPPAVTVRLQVIGTNSTTMRAKAWLDREPTDWTVQAGDNTSGLQRPGSVGLQAVRSRGSEAPSNLSVLDFVGRVAP
jgi:hypothetical protein